MGDRTIGRLDTLSPQEKRALLAQLYSGQVQKPRTAPLSLAQERILALCQLEPDNPGYNITTAYRLQGPLDVAALEQGLNQVIRRHAVLRTSFATVDGRSVQVIAPDIALRLVEQDLETIPEDAREEQVRQLILRQGQQPFDLGRALLFRACLVRLAKEEHVLVLTTHRLVFDGQCWPVLISELIAFCEAYSTGVPAALPELPLQYADYAVWQREWLHGTGDRGQGTGDRGQETGDKTQNSPLQTQLAYWREKLSGKLRLLDLPTDHPRTAAQFRSEVRSFTLPAHLSDGLTSLSRQEGVSLFVTLLAAFQVLLYRYTSQEDFVVFSSVAGRNRPELNGLIGLFANLLALRSDLSGDPTFRELLGRVRETAAGAYAHQDVPFEQILESVQVERDQRYASIFQVMFIFWPEPLPPVAWQGLSLSALDVDTKPADFDLLLHVTHTRPEMTGILRYKPDLFEAASITRLLERFQNVLADIVAAPQQRVSDLGVTKVEAEQGLVTGSVPILPSQWSYLRTPDLWVNMVEVVELHQRLNPVLLERALQHILEHHDALRTRFVYEGTWRQFISAPGEEALFTCVDLSERPITEHQAAIAATLAPMQSSLGPLKGRLIHVVLFDLGVQRPGYLVFCVHHVIFDNASLPILLEDLYTAYRQLERGEALRLPAKTTSVKAWAERLEAYLQSAAFQHQLNRELALFQDLDAETCQVAGKSGAAFQSDRRPPPDRFGSPGAPLPVDYPEGRRQNTLASTAHVQVSLSAEETGVLLKEFPRVYKIWMIDILLAALVESLTRWSGERRVTVGLVDAGRNLELPGMETIDLSRTAGCLFVPGTVMLERPDTDDPIEALRLVREQFHRFPTYGISIGIAQQAERYPEARRVLPAELRLNYLGQPSLPDLPGWSPDTSTALEDFVANRRHGDINRNPILLNCTVVILEGRLVAGWEYSENIHRRATVERVANDFVEALRAMASHHQLLREQAGETAPGLESVYVAPRTPAEELLAGVWAQALGHERVGVHDNFFELGGDSITGLRIIGMANQIGLRLTAQKLFENQTIAELAAAVEPAAAIRAETDRVTGPVPLTPAQHWFFEQALPDPQHFNQSLLLEMRQCVDPALLEAAVRSLLSHHDGLRLRFERTASGWQQINAGPEETTPFTRLDLSALSERDQDGAIERAAAQLHSSLNITAGPLIRVALFELGGQRPDRLLLLIHRLVVDPVSWRILLEDLSSAYQYLGEGQAPDLAPKTTSFKRWAERLTERAHSEEVKQELGFWLGESWRRVSPLPVDLIEGEHTASSAQTISVSLDHEETQALLHDVPRAYQTRTDEVLLTALVQTFAQWTGERWLLLDLEGYSREEPLADMDFSRTLGWLTPVFPALLDLGAANGPRETLVSVKEQLRRIPDKGVNYGVLRYLSGDAEIAGELAALPQPEVIFNYLGQPDQVLSESPVLGPALEFSAPRRGSRGMRRHLLEISASASAGRLRVAWTYSRNLHRDSTIEDLAARFMEALRALIAHCQSPDAGAYTPSDFAEFEWSEEYFVDIAAEIEKVTGEDRSG